MTSRWKPTALRAFLGRCAAVALLAASMWTPKSHAASSEAVPLQIVVARDGDTSIETVLAPGAAAPGTSIVIPVAGAISAESVTLVGADALSRARANGTCDDCRCQRGDSGYLDAAFMNRSG